MRQVPVSARRWACAAAALLALAWNGIARAGPPFVTDDAEPTDTGHWENYIYVSGANALGVTAGEGGLDINYGGYKDLQLTVVIPADYATGAGGTRTGSGDVELAAKYRFLHQNDSGWTPDVAFFPRLFLPTAAPGFGAGRPGLLLPVWAQKDFGKWSVFGGGGYQINPGPDQRNFWLSGAALERQLTDRLSLGAEVYHQTPDTIDAKPFTGLNLGITYRLLKHWSLLAAGGPGVENARQGGRYDFYLALEADF
jgi:hypothetical protein